MTPAFTGDEAGDVEPSVTTDVTDGSTTRSSSPKCPFTNWSSATTSGNSDHRDRPVSETPKHPRPASESLTPGRELQNRWYERTIQLLFVVSRSATSRVVEFANTQGSVAQERNDLTPDRGQFDDPAIPSEPSTLGS